MPRYTFISHNGSEASITYLVDDQQPLTVALPAIGQALHMMGEDAAVFLCKNDNQPVLRVDPQSSLSAQEVEPGATLLLVPGDLNPGTFPPTPFTEPVPTTAKKLRFELGFKKDGQSGSPITNPASSSNLSVAAARSALRFASVTSAEGTVTTSPSSPGHSRSSVGRESNHVHMAKDIVEGIIEMADNTVSPVMPLDTTMRSAVSHILADVAAAERPYLREWFVQLAAMLLSAQPTDPEQYLVDHFCSNRLNSSQGGSEVQPGVDSHQDSYATLEVEKRHLEPVSLTSIGATETERLASGAPVGCGRAVLELLAKLVFDKKPDDAEHFLWTWLESRSFVEEVAASTVIAYTDEGSILLPPDDPTQATLLREVPYDSPGYAVAANVISLLFAKRPVDPWNYLFSHLSGRARSSLANSVLSSKRGGQGQEETSCTSREYDDDDGDYDEISPSSRSAISGFLAVIQQKGSSASFRSSRRRSFNVGKRTQNQSKEMCTQTSCIGSPNLTPTTTTHLRTIPSAYFQSPLNGNNKCPITTFPNLCSAPLPTNAASLGHVTTATSHGGHNVFASTRSDEDDKQQRVRADFEIMRTRNRLRLERLHLEMESARREVTYRERIALSYDGTAAAQRAVVVARDALQEMEKYAAFLESHDRHLKAHMERQLRTLGQLSMPECITDAGAFDGPMVTSSHRTLLGSTAKSVLSAPTELEILQKRVELLTMEQARLCALQQANPLTVSSDFPNPST